MKREKSFAFVMVALVRALSLTPTITVEWWRSQEKIGAR
jgi:uncharacterized membrane protein